MGYTGLNGGAHKNEYIENLNLMWQPAKTFTITPSLRVQNEDWNANSSGMGTLDTGEQQPFSGNSGRDSLDVTERLDARYTGMTNWVFNAGGQWTEGQGNLHENGGLTQVKAASARAPVQFATDDPRLFQKYSANARWYPVRPARALTSAAITKSTATITTSRRTAPPTNVSTGATVGYPGFLVYQGFETLDGNVRLSLHPWNKVMLVSRYEYQTSTINTRAGPGFRLERAGYLADVHPQSSARTRAGRP